MKWNKTISLLCLAAIVSSCVLDNFEGPNATVYGNIYDNVTGELVPQDIVDGSLITVYELGYEDPAPRIWYIKNSGQYYNSMVFANNYNFKLLNGNFFPLEENDIEIKKGENQVDFWVVPYMRFEKCDISYDHETGFITAKFKIQSGNKDKVRLESFNLCIFTDPYVCKTVCMSGLAESKLTEEFDPETTLAAYCEPWEYTLYASTLDNDQVFKPGRNYYVRVCLQGAVDGVGTVKPNYSQTVKITLPEE